MDTRSSIFANYHVFECYLFSEDHSVTGLHGCYIARAYTIDCGLYITVPEVQTHYV